MRISAYGEKDTWIHRLSGAAKLVFLLMWTVANMLSLDTRALLAMLAGSLLICRLSRTGWEQVGAAMKFFFSVLAVFLPALFGADPYRGVEIYGTRLDLFRIAGGCWVTGEQIFYECNVMVKCISVFLVAAVFAVTTNPGELAASVNHIGIPYKAGYGVAAVLRDLQERQERLGERKKIREARGIGFLEAGFFGSRGRKRRQIMELRGYGKHKKRTWYAGKGLGAADYAVMAAAVALALFIAFRDGSRFYNPFVK